MTNLWLIIPEGATFIGIIYFWNWSRKTERKKTHKQAAEQLQALLEQAKGDKKIGGDKKK
jgi:hypothetical protein